MPTYLSNFLVNLLLGLTMVTADVLFGTPTFAQVCDHWLFVVGWIVVMASIISCDWPNPLG